MPYLIHHVEKGTLFLGIENGNVIPCPVHYTIQCPTLTRVSVSSGSSLVTQGQFTIPKIGLAASSSGNLDLDLISDIVNINASSSASINLKGEVNLLDLSASSSAYLDAREAQINETKARMSSSSSATIKTDMISDARLSSSASLKYIGETQVGNVNTSSSGSISQIDK